MHSSFIVSSVVIVFLSQVICDIVTNLLSEFWFSFDSVGFFLLQDNNNKFSLTFFASDFKNDN
jgi:hypothetical protein